MLFRQRMVQNWTKVGLWKWGVKNRRRVKEMYLEINQDLQVCGDEKVKEKEESGMTPRFLA